MNQLSVESDKDVLEKHKLFWETKRLARPWYRDAEYVIKALAVPLGIIALLATYKYSVLDQKVAGLELQRTSLELQKSDLSSAIEKMDAQKSALDTRVADLEKRNQAIQAENQNLQGSRDELTAAVGKLRNSADEAQFHTHLGVLLSTNPSLPPPWERNPSRDELIKILLTEPRRSSNYFDETERAFNSASDANLRATLAYVLFKATESGIWKAHFAEEIIGFLEKRPKSDPFGGTLKLDFGARIWATEGMLSSSIWNRTERISLAFRLLGISLRTRDSYLLTLALELMWGNELNLEYVKNPDEPEGFVRLVIGGIRVARDVALNRNVSLGERESFLLNLRKLSPEAYTVTIGVILSDTNTSNEVRFGMKRLLEIPPLPEIEDTADMEWWNSWVKTHKEMVDLFMEPELKHLFSMLLDERQSANKG